MSVERFYHSEFKVDGKAWEPEDWPTSAEAKEDLEDAMDHLDEQCPDALRVEGYYVESNKEGKVLVRTLEWTAERRTTNAAFKFV